MSKKEKMLETVKSLADFKILLEENLDLVVNGYLSTEIAEYALGKLNEMSKEQERKFITNIHFIDKKINDRVQQQTKIATILTSAIYITDYYGEIENYTEDELALLSVSSIYCNLDFYEKAPNIYTKEILAQVTKKSKNFAEQKDIVLVVEKLKEEEKAAVEIKKYIEDHTTIELIKEGNDYLEQNISNMEEYKL